MRRHRKKENPRGQSLETQLSEKYLIVGCGDIGLALARRLVAAGHHVTAVKRSKPDWRALGLTLAMADIEKPESLAALPTDIDQIFVILSPDRREEDAYRRLYETGIANLLAHFNQRTDNSIRPETTRPHWIFVSSTSVYGQRKGERVDEHSCTAPSGFNGRALLCAEQQFLAESKNNSIVRFSGIYGPGRNHLIRNIKAGKAVQYEPPYYTNRIHREDCVDVLFWLAQQRRTGQPVGGIYVASDDTPVPLGDVAMWLAEQLGCAAPPAQSATRRVPRQNKRCDNRRLREAGYQFTYKDYRAGYRAMLDEQRRG